MNPAVRARLAGWYAHCDAWQGADALMRRSPAQVWMRRRAADRLAVLGYHGIEDAAQFARQLDLLLETSVPVSLDRVEEAVRGGRALPPYSVLVTFDDGDTSVHSVALPLLAARGIPAVCFVVAGLIGTDTPFWWDEVEHLVRGGGRSRLLPRTDPVFAAHALKVLSERERQYALAELRDTAAHPAPRREQLTVEQVQELDVGGVVIGSHTLTHPCLDRCDDRQVEREVLGAHERLTAWLGRPVTAFAYPNGNEDARAHRLLEKTGYRSGFLYNHRLARAEDPLRIDRLVVSTRTSADRLACVLSGLHPAVFRAGRGVARAVARGAQPLARGASRSS